MCKRRGGLGYRWVVDPSSTCTSLRACAHNRTPFSTRAPTHTHSLSLSHPHPHPFLGSTATCCPLLIDTLNRPLPMPSNLRALLRDKRYTSLSLVYPRPTPALSLSPPTGPPFPLSLLTLPYCSFQSLRGKDQSPPASVDHSSLPLSSIVTPEERLQRAHWRGKLPIFPPYSGRRNLAHGYSLSVGEDLLRISSVGIRRLSSRFSSLRYTS